MTASVPSRIALATSETSARVGRGALIMLSSIWVAVMTGLPCRLASRISRFCTSGTCSNGSSTPRSPRATMIASATLDDPLQVLERGVLFDFGDQLDRSGKQRRASPPDPRDAARSSCRCSPRRAPTACSASSRSLSVMAGRAHLDAGEVHPLVGLEHPAIAHRARAPGHPAPRSRRPPAARRRAGSGCPGARPRRVRRRWSGSPRSSAAVLRSKDDQLSRQRVQRVRADSPPGCGGPADPPGWRRRSGGRASTALRSVIQRARISGVPWLELIRTTLTPASSRARIWSRLLPRRDPGWRRSWSGGLLRSYWPNRADSR